MNLGGRFFHKTPPVVKRSLDDLDLLRAPGPHDDGVGCVCLVHQLSSPPMRWKETHGAEASPRCFVFQKKNNWSFTTAIFCKNWEEAFLITFSENGTLLITYGLCGGVPTQNGGWNNCSYEILWNPCRTGEESFRSNGVKIRNLQKKHQNLISGSTLPLMILFTSANR